MQRREKILALSLAGVVGLYFGKGFVEDKILAPLRSLDGDIDAQATALEAATNSEIQLALATNAVAQAKRMSLPPDVSTARVLYQRWLEDLAQQACGFTNVKLDPMNGTGSVANLYTTVAVHLVADATYDQAVRFLDRFSEVSLLHQIKQFDASPSKTDPDNKLLIDLQIEALSLVDAPARTTLFSETQFNDAATRDQTTITVKGVKGFPEKAPFVIRSGSEWMQVTAVDKTSWTVKRAVDSSAAPHAAGETIELVPQKAGPSVKGMDEAYAVLAATNPFQRPGPKIEYNPRLSPTGTQSVVRDKPLTLKMQTESWNPAWGTPQFEFEGDTPAGLTLDGKSGELKWAPAEEVPPGEYKVRVLAVAANQKVASDLTLKLRNPNRSPVFKPLDPPKAFLGRPLTLDLSAEDPDESDRLRYSLVGTPPAGAEIDGRTGKFTWTPSEDLESGDFKVEVSVTDSGDPPKTEKRTVTVKTEDDAARFTSLTTIFGVNGVKQARFYNVAANKVTAVSVGDTFQFADVSGKILDIESEVVIVESNGERMQLGLGSSVREMKPADDEPAVPATNSEPEKQPIPVFIAPESQG